jgi:hypothetical protein
MKKVCFTQLVILVSDQILAEIKAKKKTFRAEQRQICGKFFQLFLWFG